MNMINFKFAMLFAIIITLLGCSSPEISFKDLHKAKELIISPGKDWEIHYKGKELTDYLSTFHEEKPTLTFVVSTRKGKIKVNGYWYPVKYSEEKRASRSAIIKIIVGSKYIRIRQK